VPAAAAGGGLAFEIFQDQATMQPTGSGGGREGNRDRGTAMGKRKGSFAELSENGEEEEAEDADAFRVI
jgi:hypothetical protein